MSLLTNPVITAYYNAVGLNHENAAVAFWTVVVKGLFPEEPYAFVPQMPASANDPLRRVDGQLQYVEAGTFRIMVLFFYEAKRASQSPTEMTAVEGQAFEACGSFLNANRQLTHIYAVTTIGTEARLWKCLPDRTFQSLTVDSSQRAPPQGTRSAYIDANSPDAYKLRNGFLHMKQFPPSLVYVPSVAPSQSSNQVLQPTLSVLPSTPSNTSTTPWLQHSTGRWYRYVNGQIEWN